MPYAGWHEGPRIRFNLFITIIEAMRTLVTAVYLQAHNLTSDRLKVRLEAR